MIPRISFGLLLIAMGINHARYFSDFKQFITEPMPQLAAMPSLVSGIMIVLGWVFIALLLVGGVLLITKQYHYMAHHTIMKALCSVLLWIAVVIAFGTFDVSFQAMDFAVKPIILLLLYALVLQFDPPSGKKRS